MSLGLPVEATSRSSGKRPPREFEKVVVIRAGRLRELSITEFESQFSQTEFHNGGRNYELGRLQKRSQRER